jgi:predicted phage replisome organizer
MADVKWIAVAVNMFDDEKIALIEAMPDADAIIVIWLKMLTLAGKLNNGGVLMMGNGMPYTDEMLSTLFRRPLNTVRLALATFEQYGMIEYIDDVISFPNWEKWQKVDSLDKVREQTRLRVAKHRAKQKALVDDVTLHNVTVTQYNNNYKNNNTNKEVVVRGYDFTELLTADEIHNLYAKYENANDLIEQVQNEVNAKGLQIKVSAYAYILGYAKNKGWLTK